MNRRELLRNLSVATIASIANVDAAKSITNGKPITSKKHTVAFEKPNELAPGVFFIKGKLEYFQTGDYGEVECNNGWVVFDDFVVLIDSNFPAKAKILLEEIRKTTSKPIRYVFNTHHHGDHLYANRFWFDQGAAIISHTGVIDELRKYETGYYSNGPGRWESAAEKRTDLKAFTFLPPSITFQDNLVIEDKNNRLELLHLGPGHTKGDSVAWLPEQKILFTGDSCLNGPYNLLMDAEVASWIRTLDKMKNLQPSILVPGHGDLGDSNTVYSQQAFFKKIYHWVKSEKKRGISFEVVADNLPQLRAQIKKDEKIKKYLISEPAVIPNFSLKAQAKKIFDQII